IGETTFVGREELWNHSKYIEYWHFMSLALERAKTAREAVHVITSIADQYGYASEGESFSIADPNEAWILEMVGTGTGGEGAIWVALKIPDGYISGHANMARIGEFPLNDPVNCRYSENVIKFAIEKGYYNPKSGQPFRFNEAYNPATPERLKYCESRVWSMFRRAAPSLNLSADYHRGVPGAERYPLWIMPDKKLELTDIIAIMRDHYEDTPFDMTAGIEAGPFGNPNRNRPLSYEIDGEQYSWERPISTYNTSWSFIAQMRSFMPNEIGGLIWFGEDDTYFTCYTPIYSCATSIPKPFHSGSLKQFSPDCAWWIFNLVSNYTNLRWSDAVKDVQKVQSEIENKVIARQKAIESAALELYKTDKELAAEFLTDYTAGHASSMMKKWTNLAYFLITKYNDGYVKNHKGQPETVGYSEEWLKKIIKLEPDKFKIPVWDNKTKSDEYKPF
ncbi:MAG: C69 family dipeptidase, partial [Chlorobi bacterium]|nr:C69 family dipeptidase [Chlorobiota bacterium]